MDVGLGSPRLGGDKIMVMIAAAAKWFGSKRGDDDEDVQGDDPIVRAMFKAVNLGDL
jgi:hypothetical protein